MRPALPAPGAEFTTYLLRQAGLRASLLTTSFGLTTADWDDLRQDLALECLRRLPKFDPARGHWKQFVHGVVRNHACTLASRQAGRPAFRPLGAADGIGGSEEGEPHEWEEAQADDSRAALELKIDLGRVLAGLPAELQSLARHLSEGSANTARRKTGLTQSQLKRRINRIRTAFIVAGIDLPARATSGGCR